jgi:general stress protein YciG
MSGSKAGSAKAQITIKNKYGLDEHGKSIMHKRAGTLGGAAVPSAPRGFAANKERASAAGKIGGRISRKPKKSE